MPIGTLIDFAGSTAPTGYLVCDGSAVSRSTYTALFAVLGTAYGVGDSSTTFNLPNLIDKFKQGSKTVGTIKAAGLPNATGTFDTSLANLSNSMGGSGVIDITYSDLATFYQATGNYAATRAHGFTLDLSKSNSIYGASTTVQPPAVTILPCIKY